MAAPIFSWWNEANTAQQSSWAIGTIDAGSVSADTTFLIWNNRGGASAVSDATSCTITTKDNAGGDTGELVTNKWIEVKVVSLGEATFTAIGGTTVKAIGAGGGAPAQTIQGLANNGTVGDPTADKCYAKVTCHANVPATASAGTVNFLLRVSYQYV